MHREMKRVDMLSCLADLHNANKIILVDTKKGPAYIGKQSEKQRAKNELVFAISEPATEEEIEPLDEDNVVQFPLEA
jgi:hypothetical protein